MNPFATQQNIEILSQSIPLLSAYLGSASEEDMIPCLTREKERNLYDEKNRIYLHAQTGAMQEAAHCLEGKLRADVHVLFVYGLGLGYFFEPIKSWLEGQSDRKCIFIEDSISILAQFVKSENATSIISHPQVQVSFAQDQKQEIFLRICWEKVFQAYETCILPSYLQRDESAKGYDLLLSTLRGVHIVASDTKDYGVKTSRNLRANAFTKDYAFDLRGLEGAFKDLPLLVCGAGPSLDLQLEMIAKRQNEMIILAGGSAITALTGYGIEPDICVSLDPDPPYDRFLSASAFESPFIHLSRFSSDLCRYVHGMSFPAPSGDAHLFESAFAMYDFPLDPGWTVSNFCIALAAFFQGNPILLAGMDLGYKGPSEYSKFINDSKTILQSDLQEEVFSTRADLLMTKEWIESFSAHSDALINTTPGGMFIEGVQCGTLDQISLQNFDKRALVHQQFFTQSTLSMKPTQEKLIAFEKSLRSCAEALNNLQESPKLIALYEVEIEREMAFDILLEPLWNIWKWVYLQKEGDMRTVRLAFFYEVCRKHLGMYEKTSI